MFCDACGAQLQSSQAFCSQCGKQIIGPISFAQPRPARVQEHVRLLALFWLAFAAFNTVAAVAVYIVANVIFANMHQFGAPEGPPEFVRPLLGVISVVLAAKSALGFLTGWGLLQREKWARVLALVLGFISLFTNIPFGTALGVYTMWVLLPAESEREYDALAEARAT